MPRDDVMGQPASSVASRNDPVRGKPPECSRPPRADFTRPLPGTRCVGLAPLSPSGQGIPPDNQQGTSRSFVRQIRWPSPGSSNGRQRAARRRTHPAPGPQHKRPFVLRLILAAASTGFQCRAGLCADSPPASRAASVSVSEPHGWRVRPTTPASRCSLANDTLIETDGEFPPSIGVSLLLRASMQVHNRPNKNSITHRRDELWSYTSTTHMHHAMTMANSAPAAHEGWGG